MPEKNAGNGNGNGTDPWLPRSYGGGKRKKNRERGPAAAYGIMHTPGVQSSGSLGSGMPEGTSPHMLAS
jgi:hypothetical protein